MSASKYVPGLGSQFFIHPDHVGIMGGDIDVGMIRREKYIPGLGNQFMIGANEVSEAGGADKYIPGLGKQFEVYPEHVESGTVVFSTGVAGVSVEFNGATMVTEEDGSVEFPVTTYGVYEYTTTVAGYKAGAGSARVVGNTVVPVVLEATV